MLFGVIEQLADQIAGGEEGEFAFVDAEIGGNALQVEDVLIGILRILGRLHVQHARRDTPTLDRLNVFQVGLGVLQGPGLDGVVLRFDLGQLVAERTRVGARRGDRDEILTGDHQRGHLGFEKSFLLPVAPALVDEAANEDDEDEDDRDEGVFEEGVFAGLGGVGVFHGSRPLK